VSAAKAKKPPKPATVPAAILRTRDAMHLLGMRPTEFRKRVREGILPKPIKLGRGRSVGWLRSELDQWIVDRAAAREA
jgi:prophage regulatory protein